MYPEVLASVIVEKNYGLSNKQVADMQVLVDAEAQENQGMVYVFQVAEVVREYLAENNVEELTMHEAMMERQREAEKLKEDVCFFFFFLIFFFFISTPPPLLESLVTYIITEPLLVLSMYCVLFSHKIYIIQAAAVVEEEKEEWVSSLVERHTLVTPESFKKWKAEFYAEMAANAVEVTTDEDVRLTGKELFERNAKLGMERKYSFLVFT